MPGKRSRSTSPSDTNTGVDYHFRPTRSSLAAMKKSQKKAEAENEKLILEDLGQIDRNFARSRGEIISEWRVYNGLPPLDVEAWNAEYAAIEAKALERGERVNTYRKDRKLLLPPSSGEPAFRSSRAMGFTNLYKSSEALVKEEAVAKKSTRGYLKRKEISNSTDEEEEEEEVNEDEGEGEEDGEGEDQGEDLKEEEEEDGGEEEVKVEEPAPKRRRINGMYQRHS